MKDVYEKRWRVISSEMKNKKKKVTEEATERLADILIAQIEQEINRVDYIYVTL